MSNSKYDALKLENQLCFPLYAAAREVVKRYRPYLDELDLTYTQYITMMVMWEQKEITVKALGEKLFLDSGTMTPVLKSLEAKGYVVRKRSTTDERSVSVFLVVFATMIYNFSLFLKFRLTLLICRSKSPFWISLAMTYCSKVGTVHE